MPHSAELKLRAMQQSAEFFFKFFICASALCGLALSRLISSMKPDEQCFVFMSFWNRCDFFNEIIVEELELHNLGSLNLNAMRHQT
jgi:hypothetical protein